MKRKTRENKSSRKILNDPIRENKSTRKYCFTPMCNLLWQLALDVWETCYNI